MAAKKAPSFQFYVKDWLSSATVQRMTLAEQGAYIRLLCHCWDSGDCSLPDDEKALSMLSQLGSKWLKGSHAIVREKFTPHPLKPGFLTNEKLLEVWLDNQKWREKCSRGGNAGSKARWGENKPNSQKQDEGSHQVVITNGSLNDNTASASAYCLSSKDSDATASPEVLTV